jgi:hypothetical protein
MLSFSTPSLAFLRFKPPPYRQEAYEIADETVRQLVLNCHDFDLPAMSSPYDAWEGFYRMERSEPVQEGGGRTEASIPVVAVQQPVLQFNNSPSQNEVIDETLDSLESSTPKKLTFETISEPGLDIEGIVANLPTISSQSVSPTTIDDLQSEILKQQKVSFLFMIL